MSFTVECLAGRPDQIRRAFERAGVRFKGEPRGRELSGLCPVCHDELYPSLRVNTETGAFCCFSCHISGDVVTLMWQKFGLKTADAIAQLLHCLGPGNGNGNGGSHPAEPALPPPVPEKQNAEKRLEVRSTEEEIVAEERAAIQHEGNGQPAGELSPGRKKVLMEVNRKSNVVNGLVARAEELPDEQAEKLCAQAEAILGQGDRLIPADSLSAASRVVMDTEEPASPTPPAESWPPPPRPEAFHGLAGEIVRTIAPHTEADDVAVLAHMLVMFGNAVGGSPHFRVGGDLHGANLFAVLVGRTSRGRKGTSEGQARRILAAADATWARDQIASGLSSGEGLIYQVRDPVVGSDGKVGDEGAKDRRLQVIESEFAGTLRVMRRDGNVLSSVLRQAWDSGNLRTLTKRSPLRATAAHVSVIGHVTSSELLRHMTGETDNGFANRFLWLAVRRSKLLPDGGSLTDADLAPLCKRVEAALDSARRTTEVRRDARAAELWRAEYPRLTAEHSGLFGAVTSRAEAQAIRLSLVYALLDGTREIREEHLRAALAVCDFAAASARHIFGDLLGDPVADRILRALREAGPEGLSRTTISHDVLARNCPIDRLEVSLRALAAAALAYSTTKDSGQKGGRPAEWWYAR